MDYILTIATILGGLSAIWYFLEKFKPKKSTLVQVTGPINGEPTNEANSDQVIQKMIEEYHHISITEIHPPGIVWFDLASSGRNTEFSVLYSTNQNQILDVFTTRQSGFENLYHRIRLGEELLPAYIAINSQPYFIDASRSGSGGYLDLSLCTYDGIGKLSQVYNVGPLFQGHFWITGSRLFIAGDNKRFELRKEDGSFTLVPYDKKLESQPTLGTHVLSINLSGDQLIIRYDGSPIPFERHESSFRSTLPIRSGLEEVIVVDDNLVEYAPQAIRILVDSTGFNFHHHFFYSLQPTRRGNSHIQVSHNYGDWYFIDVAVD